MVDQPHDDTEQKPRLHGDLLSTSLLAFLKNWDAYGYQLNQKLAETGMPDCDSGTVYRTLRQLEKSGFVSSFWDTSESGPARRMYSLTAAGEIFLSGWIEALQNYQRVLGSESDAGIAGGDVFEALDRALDGALDFLADALLDGGIDWSGRGGRRRCHDLAPCLRPSSGRAGKSPF